SLQRVLSIDKHSSAKLLTVFKVEYMGRTVLCSSKVNLLKRSGHKSSLGILAWPAKCRKQVWKSAKVSDSFMNKLLYLRWAFWTLWGLHRLMQGGKSFPGLLGIGLLNLHCIRAISDLGHCHQFS